MVKLAIKKAVRSIQNPEPLRWSDGKTTYIEGDEICVFIPRSDAHTPSNFKRLSNGSHNKIFKINIKGTMYKVHNVDCAFTALIMHQPGTSRFKEVINSEGTVYVPEKSQFSEEEQYAIMKAILTCKFTQKRIARHTLLKETKGRKLISASRHPLWGIGNDGKGKNKLGRILEEIRAELRQKLSQEGKITPIMTISEELLEPQAAKPPQTSIVPYTQKSYRYGNIRLQMFPPVKPAMEPPTVRLQMFPAAEPVIFPSFAQYTPSIAPAYSSCSPYIPPPQATSAAYPSIVGLMTMPAPPAQPSVFPYSSLGECPTWETATDNAYLNASAPPATQNTLTNIFYPDASAPPAIQDTPVTVPSLNIYRENPIPLGNPAYPTLSVFYSPQNTEQEAKNIEEKKDSLTSPAFPPVLGLPLEPTEEAGQDEEKRPRQQDSSPRWATRVSDRYYDLENVLEAMQMPVNTPFGFSVISPIEKETGSKLIREALGLAVRGHPSYNPSIPWQNQITGESIVTILKQYPTLATQSSNEVMEALKSKNYAVSK